MTKIIPIRQCDIDKIIKMIEYVTPDLSPGMIGNRIFIPFPFDMLHNILPLNLKFLQESYVAVENNEPLGLISLAPDGHTKTRWKINRLVLGMNAYDIGKQLIDFVVNRYGGAGVEVFLAVIDENYTEAVTLFKNACFFRGFSRINIWEYDGIYSGYRDKMPENLRKAEYEDFEKLHTLDSEAILPHFRTSMAKKPDDLKFGLKNQLINRLKGNATQRYVLENPSNNSIEALVSVFTSDNTNFWLDITLSLAYREHYEDLINFALGSIKTQNPEAKVFIGVKDYHQTGKYMADILNSHKFKQCGNFQVLVKDYWRPAEFYNERKAPAIIFPDMTSPACNILKFINES